MNTNAFQHEGRWRSGGGSPRVLIVATLRWPLAARLAIALSRAGCTVEAHCPKGHPLEKTRAVHALHRHSELFPARALSATISRVAPDFLIPCDDRAALDLLALHRSDPRMRPLMEYSLGSPAACELATERVGTMELARDCGVRTPRTVAIASAGALRSYWFQSGTAGAMLKLDRSWGGEGVWPAQTWQQAAEAYAAAVAPIKLGKALTQWLFHGDASLWQRRRQRWPAAVSLQEHVDGRPANRAVACWRGEVLAGVSVEALQTQRERGPATVVRVIDHPQMAEATRCIARQLGISGLWGFDFMLDGAGDAQLIEINPRATPIAQVPFNGRCPLAEALAGALRGQALAPAALPLAGTLVAMFPDEWRRDPVSPYLRPDILDAPWDEPELMQDCMDVPWSERGFWARLRRRMRRPLEQAPPPLSPATVPSQQIGIGGTMGLAERPSRAEDLRSAA